MEALRLLFQLLEASLGVNVDGILCDLALCMGLLAGAPQSPEAGALRGECAKGTRGQAYDVEALFEGLRRLQHFVSRCGGHGGTWATAHPSDALGEAFPAHWSASAIVLLEGLIGKVEA